MNASEVSLLAKLRRFLPFLVAERLRLASIAALSVASAVLAALAPWPLKILVDVALGQGDAPGWLISILGPDLSSSLVIVLSGIALAVLMICAAFVANGLSLLWASAGHRMLYALAADLFSHLQRMSLAFHQRNKVGDLLSRVTVDSWCVYRLAVQLLLQPFTQVLTILAVGTAAISINLLLTLLIFVMAPVLAWSVRRFGGRIRKRSRAHHEAFAAVSSFVQQVLSNIPLVQTFGLLNRNTDVFRNLGGSMQQTAHRLVLSRDGYSVLNGVALAVGAAAVMVMGAFEVARGAMTVGGLIVFMAYVDLLRISVQGLLGAYGQVRDIEASMDRLLIILDAEQDVTDHPGATPFHQSSDTGVSVEFSNVSFCYDGREPALSDITLFIRAGETLALVGPTGAGKSTLAGLVPRFHDPHEGCIRIDGRDVRDITLASLRSNVSLVLQESMLLPVSIRDNIAYGRPDASADEVREAARAANADEFILALEDGYETVIGERGATLSGGQKQRLSIARAIVRDAPVLILDEPTSALDPDTEALVFEAIERLKSGRTTLVIAHRLSTVERAQRIAVLDGGRIVEIGTPAELLADRARFWRMCNYGSLAHIGVAT